MGRRDTKPTGAGRRSQVSRTLSKLLRHQAQNERVPITKEGWVRMDDLLAWKGLKEPRMSPAVKLDEIFDVVEDDGWHGKGRFGVRLVGESDAAASVDGAATGRAVDTLQDTLQDMSTGVERLTVESMDQSAQQSSQPEGQPPLAKSNEPISKNSPETTTALNHFSLNPKTPPSHYLIRATQGHSIKTVESEGLLTPITLDDPSSIPNTVVHGTFYGAWDSILSSGGLKSMSRNMVHFATGPSITEILPDILNPGNTTDPPSDVDNDSTAATNEHHTGGGGAEGKEEKPRPRMQTKSDVEAVLSKNKVISGMRWDAQILIYIDLKRLLDDAKTNNWDMKWYRSDNGVILTEGVHIPPSPSSPRDGDDDDNGGGDDIKLVPKEYFSHAVDIKSNSNSGNGILLYEYPRGEVSQLLEHLKKKGMPFGKGGHMKQRGRGRGHNHDRSRGRGKHGGHGGRRGKGRDEMQQDDDDDDDDDDED